MIATEDEDSEQSYHSIVEASLFETFGRSTLGKAILEKNPRYVENCYVNYPTLMPELSRCGHFCIRWQGDLDMMKVIIHTGIDVN